MVGNYFTVLHMCGQQGSRKLLAALALLPDKLKSHRQMIKITYILSKTVHVMDHDRHRLSIKERISVSHGT